jgi:hypothetical protein
VFLPTNSARGTTTLCIMTVSITTLIIKKHDAKHTKHDTIQVSLMLIVANKLSMLSVIMLSVVILNVIVPCTDLNSAETCSSG